MTVRVLTLSHSEEMESRCQESLLVFSDVHLGSDLNDWGAKTVKRTSAIDRDLVALLAHYRSTPAPSGRWRVVIAGDFIDFIGMTITCEESSLPHLTEEERAHGLGNGEEHSREKLRRVAIRHGDVFSELAMFVAQGHALTLIHGNHDLEFHWDGVKDDLRAILLQHARTNEALDEHEFLARIEFQPWFFYRHGVAYIEHGHQYDPFCSTANVMAPLSPLDPRRVARGFSETLLRFVVRPTRGMTEHGHENLGIAHYLRFGWRLGVSGMMRLVVRFVRAIVELLRLRSEHLSDAARALRKLHSRRVAAFAKATQVRKERLHALLSLHAQPITHSIAGVMASLLLDRLVLAVLSIAALIMVAIGATLTRPHPALLSVGVLVLVTWGLTHRYFAKRRLVDPSVTLGERAGQLSRIFPAAFVVMGHTHVPVERPIGAATYINLGSWAEEELLEADDTIEPPTPAARTHLVIHVGEAGAEAQLYRWDASVGIAQKV
jgi:UDP-2,3-diacylglucosamine pyrophosphatase LpxH